MICWVYARDGIAEMASRSGVTNVRNLWNANAGINLGLSGESVFFSDEALDPAK